jgi:hypothetical protein
MSWIAALAAISLAGCVQDPELGFCGDDVPHDYGLDVELAGADTTQTYEIDVQADDTAFELTYAAGADDEVEIDLGTGFTLYGSVGQTQRDSDSPLYSELELLIRRPDYSDGFGPETATITVTMQGESVTETFTPVYDILPPHQGPMCREEHADVTMSVPTP